MYIIACDLAHIEMKSVSRQLKYTLTMSVRSAANPPPKSHFYQKYCFGIDNLPYQVNKNFHYLSYLSWRWLWPGSTTRSSTTSYWTVRLNSCRFRWWRWSGLSRMITLNWNLIIILQKYTSGDLKYRENCSTLDQTHKIHIIHVNTYSTCFQNPKIAEVPSVFAQPTKRLKIPLYLFETKVMTQTTKSSLSYGQ